MKSGGLNGPSVVNILFIDHANTVIYVEQSPCEIPSSDLMFILLQTGHLWWKWDGADREGAVLVFLHLFFEAPQLVLHLSWELSSQDVVQTGT